MNIKAQVTELEGKLVVIVPIDGDLVCFKNFRYWNPRHLIGLIDHRMCERYRGRLNKEWWRDASINSGKLNSWENIDNEQD